MSPDEEEGTGAPRAPGPEGRRPRLVRAALVALGLVAAVALVGWISAAGEVDRLESALATRTRALEAARAELRAWEGHRDAVSARLESLTGELEAVRELVARGPAGEGAAAGPGSEGPDEEPAR